MSEATLVTHMTRRYCMKATRRTSAPYASANIVIEAAPPGAEPQIALVPGSTCQRASDQPTIAAITMVDMTPSANTGHCIATSFTMDAGMARAIMQAMMPCVAAKTVSG